MGVQGAEDRGKDMVDGGDRGKVGCVGKDNIQNSKEGVNGGDGLVDLQGIVFSGGHKVRVKTGAVEVRCISRHTGRGRRAEGAGKWETQWATS